MVQRINALKGKIMKCYKQISVLFFSLVILSCSETSQNDLIHVKPGQEVGVREKSKSLEAITNSIAANTKSYDWLNWDSAKMAGSVMNVPTRELIPENIKEQLIVELYSK